MTVSITEILGRSEQGATEPFICRADDGNIYFVKGSGAGRRSQVYEWVAGNLAVCLDLPIAPFEIVHVPEALVENNPIYNDLKSGFAFGSQRQRIMELNFAGIEQVPDQMQMLIFAFDWWIKNEDRTLTDSGGNPNLFWEPGEGKLVVIDHNQAFDTNFSTVSFKDNHVFNLQVNTLYGDVFFRKEFEDKFKVALGQWPNICSEIPEEWYYADPDKTVDADFNLDSMFEILNRCNNNSLWNNL